MRYAALTLILLAGAASADIVVPIRTLPARTLIGAADLELDDQVLPGAVSDLDSLVGLETKVALYAGRPIRPADVGLPAIVERNQTLSLVFRLGGLTIEAAGRALDRGSPGDVIRAMNLTSHATVMAMLGVDGVGYVLP